MCFDKCPGPNYLKLPSSGNDPSLTKAQQYSHLAQYGKSKKVTIYTPLPPPPVTVPPTYIEFKVVSLNIYNKVIVNKNLSQVVG